MTLRATSVLALVAGLGLAACDNSEYEARIADLEGQLGTAQSEVGELEDQLETAGGEVGELEDQLESARGQLEGFEAMETELQEARARIEELEGEAEAAEFTSAEGAGTDAAGMRAPLGDAVSALREADTQLQQLAQTLSSEGYEDADLGPVRTTLETAAQSISEAADAAGVDLDAMER